MPYIVIPAQAGIQTVASQPFPINAWKPNPWIPACAGITIQGIFYFDPLYKSDFQTASPLFRIIRKRIRPKYRYERQQIKHEYGGGQNLGDSDEEYRIHVH